MDWQTITGALLVVGGALTAAWQWIKSKTPRGVDLIEQTINRLQGENSDGSPTRLLALEYVEALYRYFEAKGNTNGMEAVQIVVSEILATKKG